MNGIKLTMMAVLLAVGLLFSSNAMAGKGRGAGDGTGPIVDIYAGVPVTVTGVVATIGTSGEGWQIDTGSELVTVYGMGPIRFWESLDVARPEVGETITVDGYEVTLSDGTTRIIATTVTVGDQTVELRDSESGLPLWRGAGQGAGASGAGGGYGLRDGSCLTAQ